MLTVQDCYEHIRRTLGGDLPADSVQPVAILNQAGEHLVSMHDWLWLRRPPYHLKFQDTLAFTTATATNGEAVISIPQATDYTATGGSGVVLPGTGTAVAGTYYITWQDGTTFGLDRAPVPAGDANASGIHGSITSNAIVLPSDFRKVIQVVATDSLITTVTLTDLETIMRLRTNSVVVGSLRYFCCVTWTPNLNTNYGAPVPQLEIYPAPTAENLNALLLEYIAGWAAIDDDTAVIPVPAFIEPLYIQLIRAFARGYEEEDVAPLDARLALIHKGPLFKVAAERDGEIQGSLGQMRGGLAAFDVPRGINYIDATVGGPT